MVLQWDLKEEGQFGRERHRNTYEDIPCRVVSSDIDASWWRISPSLVSHTPIFLLSNKPRALLLLIVAYNVPNSLQQVHSKPACSCERLLDACSMKIEHYNIAKLIEIDGIFS